MSVRAVSGATVPVAIALVMACAITLGVPGTAGAQSGAGDDSASPIAAWSRTEAVSETRGSTRERGAAVFNNWCSACHSHGPQNAPGTQSLQFKYRGEVPAALEDRTDLTPELVAFYVRNGVATMPFFRPTEISDADLDALAAYLAKD
jgi:mono/diheme cytochrome c family protein